MKSKVYTRLVISYLGFAAKTVKSIGLSYVPFFRRSVPKKCKMA